MIIIKINYEKNVGSRLSPWLCGHSCTWEHDTQLFMSFGQLACHGSFLINYTVLFASLFRTLWLIATVHLFSKLLSCHRVILVITGKANFCHDILYNDQVTFVRELEIQFQHS